MSNRAVKYARLQTNAYVVGAGELGTVFPPQTKVLEGLTMAVSDLGLMISFKYQGHTKELLIPLANVSLMELASELKPVAAVKAVK
jgi:hypothetical protein